ncbi:glucosyltransferase domain-containing protein [Enterobacter soli]|uniref:glucosyltransferase domain-containing protein n=1 Tax=Enterobacter soli TaxID=885040 RepID=UPI00289EF4C9|nr:glucosyltransferase domain-containing protein [Enterobacter soli]
MFKSINKEISLRNAGLLSFGLILFAYFPLLNDRIYFVDDITRSIKGYFGWTELGRPLTEWLAMLMTINSGILADITPLPQLLSIFVLSCTVLILIRNAFSRVSIAAVLISTTAVINPLVLGNMLYRLDSLSMVFSIMFSVLAWEKFNNGKIALTLRKVRTSP